MGASGFLGSHVTRQLVARGDAVRVWVRPSSSTAAFEELGVEVVRGELTDAAALRAAMRDVDAVHYCIVDTRAWLRDPAPLFRTNVELLRHALDAAVEVDVPRFVFCSTVGTIGIVEEGLASEDTEHNWLHLGGPYIRTRYDAEQLVQSSHRDRGLNAVVLCVATTYGTRDHGPTPHGKLVAAAALGKLPVSVRGAAMEVVGIEDAAAAFLLAESNGRLGERYIISEAFMPTSEVLRTAAEAGNVRPPRLAVSIGTLRVLGVVGGVVTRLLRKDSVISPVSVRLMHLMSPLDHGKAERELGWAPRPTHHSIREHAEYLVGRRRGSTD
jgi:dihydroflavonol-4-reductase